MGVPVIPNDSNERANGVAVTRDPVDQTQGNDYVNTQLGEDLVPNPDALWVPEEVLLAASGSGSTPVRASNQVPDGTWLLSPEHLSQLRSCLTIIHQRFRALDRATAADFAMEIEFKVTQEGKLAIKQARPWVN